MYVCLDNSVRKVELGLYVLYNGVHFVFGYEVG